MKEDWKECKLGDICSYSKERINISRLNNENYISTENMLPNRGGITKVTTLPTAEFTPSFEKKDTLVSNIRPYFKKIWKAEVSGGCSADVLVFKANEKVSKDYLYYILADDEFFKYSMATSKGTKMPRGDKLAIMNYPILLPNLSTQQKIAQILSSLDDKIELNNKINDNLEQQAQAFFNEFLLSNKFDNLSTVEKVVLTADTGADAIQKAPIVDYDTGIKCIRVGDMTNFRSYYEWSFTKVTDEVFKRYQLHKDDIVVTRTAVLGLNTIIPEDLSAVYNNGLIRLTVDTSVILPLYLYRQFQTKDFANYIARIESETSVRPNMKINYLLKYNFVLPSITKQGKLIELLTPIINQQNNLISENKQLESLRNTLLPKLLNGEIEV